jgi:hypothetical protein
LHVERKGRKQRGGVSHRQSVHSVFDNTCEPSIRFPNIVEKGDRRPGKQKRSSVDGPPSVAHLPDMLGGHARSRDGGRWT